MSSLDDNGGTSWTGTTWKRPVKKARLGPPDVYPQDVKQREDELSAVTLKQGFIYAPVSLDEYGSVRSSASHVPAGQVSAYFSSLLIKRQELSIIQDSSKKRTLFTNKDNFFPAAQAKTNPAIKANFDAFFKELHVSRPASPLPKRIPLFNKKEDVFLACCDYNVPYVKAAWFMKLLAAHAALQADVKVKKRQVNDPTLEWTMVLLKCLKDLLHKISDSYRLTAVDKNDGSSNGAGTLGAASSLGATSSNSMDYETSSKQWKYCFGLMQHLYEEALIERHEVCSWLVETTEGARVKGDGGLLKLIAPCLLKFTADIFHSEILSRKLVSSCTRYLHNICGRKSQKSSLQLLEDALECSHHSVPVRICISIVQLAVVNCSSSCLWLLNLNEETSASRNSAGNGSNVAWSNEGSPLDIPLPSPSDMPITPSLATTDPHFFQKLKDKEEELCERSVAVETRWANPRITADENKTHNVWLLVRTLEALDRYAFHKSDGKDNLDKLYSAIRDLLSSPDATCDTSLFVWRQEVEALIRLLCQWSVSTRRSGLHRGMVIGLVLERLQVDVVAHWKTRHNHQEGEAPYMFQECLMRYLDEEASKEIAGHETLPDSPPFINVLLLFTELVNHHLFSHDLYVRALIATGLISQPPVAPRPPPPPPPPQMQYNPASHVIMSQHGIMDHGGHDNNPGGYYGMVHTVSPKVPTASPLYGFEHVGPSTSAYGSMSSSMPSPMAAPLYPPPSRQWSQPHPNIPLPPLYSSQGALVSYSSQPDYLTTDLSLLDGFDEKPASVSSIVSEAQPSTFHTLPDSSKSNPHRTFLLHLPIAPNQDGEDHEIKQRNILLYGVGRARQEAKDNVKRLTKDILKLLSKKRCYDVSDANRLKYPKSLADTCTELRHRFKHVSVFDRQQINNTVMPALIHALHSLLNGTSNYMPALESMTCIVQMCEGALDLGQLLRRVIEILSIVKGIEALLINKQVPILVAAILPSVVLHCVGLLRKYHNCLVLCPERTASAFEALRLIVANSCFMVGQCSSTERCVLACMYDLYQCCSILQARYNDFHAASRNISSIIMKKTKPAPKAETWDPSFMSEYLQDLTRRPSSDTIKRLSEPLGQHSFVVNTLIAVCRSDHNMHDADRVNDLAHLCAEMTASCIGLTAEWLAAFQALCLQFTFNKTIPYSDLLEVVKGYLGDKCVQERLAIFCCILVGRHCIRLEDFIGYVAIVTLMAASRHATGDENGGRLVAHIMLRLLRGSHGPPEEPQAPLPVFYLKYPWDRALLASARRDLGVAPLLAVLKAMLVLSESAGGQSLKNGQGSSTSGVKRESMDFDEAGLFASADQPIGYEIVGLADFARMALREICQEEVARELVLKELENLFSLDLLLDPIMVVQQTRHLVHLICYPPQAAATFAEERPDYPMYIMHRILHSLDQWNIRICWVELQLMLEPPITSQSATGPNPSPQETAAKTAEHNTMVETFARAVIEAFQLKVTDTATSQPSHHLGHVKKGKAQSMVRYELDSGQHTWYIPALVTKLYLPVQQKILKHIIGVIDKHPLSFRPKERDKMAQSTLLLGCPPFISLMSTCMGEVPELGKAAEGGKQQSSQDNFAVKENVLRAILGQLFRFVEEEVRSAVAPNAEDRSRATVSQAISLRLSVVGSLFDCIQKRHHLALEWAVLLGQLIISGCVDPVHSTPPVFHIVFDMLTVLTHNLLAFDSLVVSQTSPGSAGQADAKASTSSSSTSGNEERKSYPSLVKRLRKEIGEKKTAGILHIRTLLPIAKKNLEVLTVEPYGTTTDAKGNKIVPFDAVSDKRLNLLQALHKVQLNPWDIMEGFRNIHPLCWSFFGAVRLERRVLSVESSRYLMAWHTHAAEKTLEYYLELPPIPLAIQQEEAASVIADSEPAVSETTSLDTASPRSPRSARAPKNKRGSISQGPGPSAKKRQTKSPAVLGGPHYATSNMPLGAGGHMMGSGNTVYGGGPETLPQPINWYNAGGGPAPHGVPPSQQGQLPSHPHMGGAPAMHLPQQPPLPRMMATTYNPGPAASSYSLQQQQQQQQHHMQQQQQNRRMAAHLGARSNLQNLIHARQAHANMQGQSLQQQQNPTLNYMLSAQGPSVTTSQQQLQAEAQRNLAMQQQQQQQQQQQGSQINPQMGHVQQQQQQQQTPQPGAGYSQIAAQSLLQQLRQKYPTMTQQQQQDMMMQIRNSQQQRLANRQQVQQQQQQAQQLQQQQRYYGQNQPSQQAVQYLSGPTPAPAPSAQYQQPDQRQQMFMQQQQPQQMYGQQQQGQPR